MKYLFILLTVATCCMCAEVKAVSYYDQERNPLTLEIIRPSDRKFPGTPGGSLLIINHAPHQPVGYGHLFDDTRNEGFIKFNTDSLSTLFTNELAQLMRQSGHFGKVRPISTSDVPTDAPFEPTRMTTDDASLLASMWKADMVMVVEWVYIKSMLNAEYSYEHNAFKGSYDMTVTSQVSLYTDRGKTLYHTYNNVDSSYVQELGEGLDEAISYLPHASVVFADATISGVEGLGKRLFPSTEYQERYVFECRRDKLSKEAREATEANNWEHARLIWETQIANSKQEKVVVYAHLNMALYWELKENMGTALRYLDSVKESYGLKSKPDRMPLSYINEYSTILKQRKADIERLDKQLQNKL